MLQKFLAILFAVFAFNVVMFNVGWPEVGTFGYLLYINLIQVYFFLAYQSEVKYARHAYAGTASLVAILAATLGLFRASEVSLQMLAALSMGLSVLSLYLFSSGHVNITSALEGVFMPLSLVRAWFHAWFSLVSHTTYGLAHLTRLHKHLKSKTHWGMFVLGISFFIPVTIVLVLSVLLVDAYVFSRIANGLFLLGIDISQLSESLRQRISSTVLLLMILVPLTFMETSPILDIQKSDKRLEMMQVFIQMISALVMVSLAIFIGKQTLNLWQTDGYTVSNLFAQYSVELTFLHFFTIAGLVLGLASMSVWVLRLEKSKDIWLRLTQTVSLSLLSLNSVLYGFMLFVYIGEFGLSRMRIYGAFMILLVLMFSLWLLLRMIVPMFWGWQVAEVGLLVWFIFSINLINVDGLIAREWQALSHTNIDHTYIATLSGDAVLGWSKAFNHAKKIIENYSVDEYSREELREAHVIVSQLRLQYWQLTLEYGSARQAETLSYLGYLETSNRDANMYRQLSRTNLAKWYAYQNLSNSISTEELVRLEELAVELERQYLNQ